MTIVIKNFEHLQQLLARGERIVDAEIPNPLGKDLIARYPVNRPIDKTNVHNIKRDLLEKNYNTSLHQAIDFFADGRMANGHHRLLASIEAGVPLITDIQPGLTSSKGLDIGKRRNLAADLKHHGANQYTEKHSLLLQHIIKALFKAKDPRGGKGGEVPQGAYYDQNKTFIEECADKAIALAALVPRRSRRSYDFKELGEARALMIAVDNLDPKVVDDFLTETVQGIGPDDAIPAVLYSAFQGRRGEIPKYSSEKKVAVLREALVQYHLPREKMPRIEIILARRRKRIREEEKKQRS